MSPRNSIVKVERFPALDSSKVRPTLRPINYGFRTTKVLVDEKIPGNFFQMWSESVRWGLLQTHPVHVSEDSKKYRQMVKDLTLDNEGVWELERMSSQNEKVDAPIPMLMVYYSICWVLDKLYQDKPIERFWFLETIARMPYFSYVSIYHLYETLGFWSLDSKVKTLHVAEESNECLHLQIIESLGGGQRWVDRFLARHVSILYFFVLILLFLIDPKSAYNSSELLESHAVSTYSQFLRENETALKTIPPPEVAIEYYQMSNPLRNVYETQIRNDYIMPRNLYDVFLNIAEDEMAHANMMRFLKSLPQ